MIKVDVIRENGMVRSIKAEGHSGYDIISKDIVCSSVSTAIIMTINLLKKLNVNVKVIEDEKKPLISLTILSDTDNSVNLILENLVFTLEEVSKQYKKYLKINN